MLHASLKKKIKKNEYKAQAEITEAQWSYGHVRKSERVRGNRESEKKDYVDVESQKAWDAERASGDGVRTPNFS